MIVDTFTGLEWSHLYATKNGIIELTCELFQKWKDMNIPVKIFRRENAYENKKLEQWWSSSDWNFGINFEYTANGDMEVGVLNIENRGREMMIAEKIPCPLR